MVKKLWVLRHGQAEHHFGEKDFNRLLTPEGKARIREVGRLVANVCNPDRIWCSAAKRTRQTADIYLKELDQYGRVEFPEELYKITTTGIVDLINKKGGRASSILIIGHNPVLSALVDELSGQSFNNLGPGDLVEIDFYDLEWSEVSAGTGVLKSR